MSVEWTGLGPELLLRLDRDAPQPLRVQLEGELRDAIREGRLAGGERLPSSRVLARELGISRGLVSDCYAQLQAEGYLTSRGGSATRVAEGLQAVAAEPRRAAPPERVEIDFLAGVNDLTSFPRNDWSWAVRQACREATSEALGYADARGRPELRSVVAAYQRRVRGAVAGRTTSSSARASPRASASCCARWSTPASARSPSRIPATTTTSCCSGRGSRSCASPSTSTASAPTRSPRPTRAP